MPNLTFLLSVVVEPQRDHTPDLGRLDVRFQKTWTIERKWKHEAGFEDDQHVHFLFGAPTQLRRLKPEIIVSCELGMRSVMSVSGCAYRSFDFFPAQLTRRCSIPAQPHASRPFDAAVVHRTA
jgi:hypothetical protein